MESVVNEQIDQEFKKQWVEALRSDKYKQGIGLLSQYGRFCCLGVACELLVTKNILVKNESGGQVSYGKEKNTILLPKEAQEYINLPESPKISNKYLSALNDNGSSFEEIANLIEKYF